MNRAADEQFVQTRRTPWRRAFEWLLRIAFMTLHSNHRVLGIKVVVSDSTVMESACVDRLQEVLQLLLDVDPQRYRLVRRYLAHVIVWPGDYTAFDRWGGVHLASRYLLGAPVGIVAGGLVHEAVHLRIARRGVAYVPSVRSRIERLCVQEQATFLRRLPVDGSRWAHDAEADLDTPWWTDEKRREDLDRAAKQAGLSERARSLLRRWS